MSFPRKVVDESDKVSCSTTRCGLNPLLIGDMCKPFTTKNSQMRHIGFPTTPRFLRGLGIKSLGWTSIFDVHRGVHRFAPKFKSQPLSKNHASCTLHDGSIGTFRNTVLLWGIWRTCLSLNSTFRKKCIKLLGHKFSSIVGT